MMCESCHNAPASVNVSFTDTAFNVCGGCAEAHFDRAAYESFIEDQVARYGEFTR